MQIIFRLSFVHVTFALSLEGIIQRNFQVHLMWDAVWSSSELSSLFILLFFSLFELVMSSYFASLEIEMLNIPHKHESVIWIFWCLFCWECIELYSNYNNQILGLVVLSWNRTDYRRLCKGKTDCSLFH